MRAAVVGGGPAGFYAAQALARKFPTCTVDIIERLPVPFGLVRYGVAPDHPSTKNVINNFTSFMDSNRHRINFYGNINVSESSPVTPHVLGLRYNVTLFATGAHAPRTLPNVDIPPRRVHLAQDFVFWINGHPDVHSSHEDKSVAARIERDLASSTHIAVIGIGNVAIDIARLLLRPVDDLRSTDISPLALEVLSASPVSSVTLIGRKNPLNAAWTTAALREVVAKIPGIETRCNHDAVRKDLESQNLARSKKSAMKLLLEKTVDENLHSQSSENNQKKLLRLHFQKAPEQLVLRDHFIEAHMRYQGHREQNLPRTTIELYDSVFLSLGYQGGSQSAHNVGWANGTARGIIGDNKWDAESVVSRISLDPENTSRRHGVEAWLRQTGSKFVTWEGWKRIDNEEKRRGLATGRVGGRQKIERIPELLEVAGSSTDYTVKTDESEAPV